MDVKLCEAQITFLYESKENTLLHYTDTFIFVNYKYMHESEELTISGQQPSIQFQEYEQFQWHIRTHHYQKLVISFYLSNKENKSESYLALYEGPSSYAQELCIFEEYLYLIMGNVTVSTETFQGFVAVTLQRYLAFNHAIKYTRIYMDAMANQKHIPYGKEMAIYFPDSTCSFSRPFTLCQWMLKSNRFFRLSVDEMVHTAPVDQFCHYFGVSVYNIPQHVAAEWLGGYKLNIPLNSFEKNDLLQEIYDHHTVCDIVTFIALPVKFRTIHSTTGKILLTIYFYSPFLQAIPSVTQCMLRSKMFYFKTCL